jgi:threonine aldolase
MRQAGILAAAGLTALAEHPPLLAGDHLRARKLEQGLAELPGVSVQPGDINMVFFRWSAGEDAQKARETAAAFRGRGILINPPEGGLFRFVTHYWIGDKETEAVLAASREIFR